jgi:hypothetical protein
MKMNVDEVTGEVVEFPPTVRMWKMENSAPVRVLTLEEALEVVRHHPHLWSKADLQNVETTLRQLWGAAS